LAEFAYNNSYQSSLRMAPFEALYGRRCRTPLNWCQPEEREVFRPDLVTEAERKVKLIRKNLEAAQVRQKSYHDKRRKPLQFEVGDFVYLKVSPTKGVQRFGIKGKLAPYYIGPYVIIEACGTVAYKLKLPPKMSVIHNVFHVSQLKKCVPLPTKIIAEPELETSQIYRTKSTLPRFWIARKDQLGLNRSKCIRSNGVITQRKRLLGRRRNFYVRTSPIVYLRELVHNHAQPLPLLFESKYKENEINIKRIG
jgi:hypothetical protein